MGPYSWFKTNSCSVKSTVLHISFLPRPQQRQISALIVLLSVICAPIHNLAQTKVQDLKFGVADATAFGEEVQRQQQQIANYSHIEVVSLVDDQAKKATIMYALQRLAGVEQLTAADEPALRNLKATEPEDAVFIYFAGHGTADGQRFYLIPHDLGYTGDRNEIDAAGFQTILEHSISDLELERAVEGIDADKLLMVIDACNSGQALEAEERRRGPMNSKGLAQLAYEKGMYILTAAQSYQAAQEVSQLGHGLLTYALVEEGLKQGAADSDPKDGQIVLREWFDYATTRVPNMQLEKLKAARNLGVGLSFVEPDAEPISAAPSGERRVTQTPRVFYRRRIRRSTINRRQAMKLVRPISWNPFKGFVIACHSSDKEIVCWHFGEEL